MQKRYAQALLLLGYQLSPTNAIFGEFESEWECQRGPTVAAPLWNSESLTPTDCTHYCMEHDLTNTDFEGTLCCHYQLYSYGGSCSLYGLEHRKEDEFDDGPEFIDGVTDEWYASFLFDHGDYNGWDKSPYGEIFLRTNFENGQQHDFGRWSLHLLEHGSYFGYWDSHFDNGNFDLLNGERAPERLICENEDYHPGDRLWYCEINFGDNTLNGNSLHVYELYFSEDLTEVVSGSTRTKYKPNGNVSQVNNYPTSGGWSWRLLQAEC